MTTAIFEPAADPKFQAVEAADLNELVRGQDMRLIEHLSPLVLERNVTLDLTGVERIDAAGIAALVSLYCKACESGHRFTVTNASERVRQILAIVGLDRFFLSHNAVQNSQYGARMQRPAA
jgi:anti-anti-sigma factor